MAGEQELVAKIRRKAGAAGTPKSLVLGIGDDCAVWRPAAGEDLVFTTDLLIEDVHFRQQTHSAAEVGHKALARGLSDIAAMGAAPRFCLLSLAAAQWTDARWLDGFYAGLLELARNNRHHSRRGETWRRPKRFACRHRGLRCGAQRQGVTAWRGEAG